MCLSLLVLASLLLPVSLGAAGTDPSCPDPAVPVAALLLPPPKHDSAHTKAELQELLRLQELRTPQQIEHVRGDDHRTVQRFLSGIGIKIEQLSASGSIVEHMVREAKTTFMRTRPYRLHENKLHALKN